jgi:hypothetical protein
MDSPNFNKFYRDHSRNTPRCGEKDPGTRGNKKQIFDVSSPRIELHSSSKNDQEESKQMIWYLNDCISLSVTILGLR